MGNLRDSSLFAESWNVAWRRRPQGSLLYETETPFNIIKNSWRYWAADPFVFEKDGATYFFAELYDYIRCRGVIGFCEIRDSKTTKWIPVIVEPYHLSYPCIFCIDNKVYIMPESGAAKELSVYEAVDFPHKWKKTKILKSNVCFADTTPLGGKNMRFAVAHNVKDSANPELIITDLSNKCEDVVVKNVFSFHSRPAGNVFELDGRSIRPSQYSLNSGSGYGKGVVFNQYFINDSIHYSEIEIKTILPQQLSFTKRIFADGMHTYNANDNIEVIDIKTRRFNIVNLFFRIMSKLTRK